MFFNNLHSSYGKMLELFFSYFGFKKKDVKTLLRPANLNFESPQIIKVLKLFHDHPGRWYALLEISRMMRLKAEKTRLILNYLINEKLLRWQFFSFGWIVYTLEEGVEDRVADILRQQREEK